MPEPRIMRWYFPGTVQPITLPTDPNEGDVLIAPNAVYEYRDGEWVAQEEKP